MSLATSIAADAKPTRRRVSKATRAQADAKQKLSVYLTPENARRLGIAAVMEGKSQSEIVDDLLAAALRRWVVQDRAKPAEDSGRATDVEMIGTAAA